jgi:hypothetical protein
VLGAALAAGIGAVVGNAAGAAGAFNADVNNRQLHPDQLKGIEKLAKNGVGTDVELMAVLCVLQNCDVNGLLGVDPNAQEIYKAGVEMLKSDPELFKKLGESIQSAGLLSGGFAYEPGNWDFTKDAIGLSFENSIYRAVDNLTTSPDSWSDWLIGTVKGLGNLNPDLQVPAPLSNADQERGAVWGAAVGLVTGAVVGARVAVGEIKLGASGRQLFPNLAPMDDIIPAVTFPARQIQKVGYSGKLAYVVTESGELVIGRTGHISLSRGSAVLAAGEARFVNGELRVIDNASGHYQPKGLSAQNAAETAFQRAGFDGFKYIEKNFP